MTDTVVVDKHNTVVISTPSGGTVVESNQQPQVIYTGIMGPAGPPGTAIPLSNLQDVDTTILRNGSVLVYNNTNLKWTSTTLLNQQTVDSGEF
jgi:hypothetical protein